VKKERRLHPRVAMRLEVRREGISGRNHEKTTDVSEGGCYIESISKVVVGQHIRFQIQLPGGSWMPLSGTALYQQPHLGFGVQFMNLTEEDRARLSCIRRPDNTTKASD